MRCRNCGNTVESGRDHCPRCGAEIHYNGKTIFYGKAYHEKLTIKDLFTDAFKRHPKDAGVRMFMAGTPETTPSPENMLQEWDKPWLFVRVIGVGLLFAFLSFFMAAELGHRLGVYLLLSLGALIMPIGILTFFWEINIPRDIPIYRVAVIFLIGGMLSLIFTIVLPFDDGPAFLAPLTEEPGKVFALAIFIYMLDSRYIFGGLLIGAAVGAGFTSFENILYAMNSESLEVLLIRSILAIGGHVTWAAIEGGALMMAKGNEKLRLRHFVDQRFIRYFLACMGLHCLWNTDFTLLPLPLIVDLKYGLLSAGAVLLVFSVIKKAIKQVLLVAEGKTGSEIKDQARCPALIPSSGPLAGSFLPLESRITIGRDAQNCNLIIRDVPYISRRHCSVEVQNGSVYIMDLGSKYGTFLQTGERIPANKWVRVNDAFYLVNRDNTFRISEH